MEWGDVAAWASVGVAIAFGISGLWVGQVANRRARQASHAAQRSNDIATEALRQAAEANKIAEEANELSSDANALVAREHAKHAEQHLVEWAVDRHINGQPFVMLRNLSNDVAHSVAVRVAAHKTLKSSDRYGDVAGLGELRLPLPDSVTEHFGKQHLIAIVGDERLYNELIQSLELTVSWVSELGNVHQQILKIAVR